MQDQGTSNGIRCDINFDGDANDDDNHNDKNLIQDDTDESFHTTKADHVNTEDLSDEDDNDEADVTSKSNYLLREPDSDLGIFWNTSYSHVVSSMQIAEEVGTDQKHPPIWIQEGTETVWRRR